MEIQQATIVKVLPTQIWVESDMLGGRHVVLQHEGCEAFTYASFHYDYSYTSNSGTWDAAHSLALALGATEPVENKQRPFAPMPTQDELREQIKELQELLKATDEPQ